MEQIRVFVTIIAQRDVNVQLMIAINQQRALVVLRRNYDTIDVVFAFGVFERLFSDRRKNLNRLTDGRSRAL